MKTEFRSSDSPRGSGYNEGLLTRTMAPNSVGMLVRKEKKQIEPHSGDSASNHLDDAERNVLGDSICSLMEKTRTGCSDAKSDLLQQLRSYLAIVASSRMNSKFQAKFDESDVVQQSIAVALQKFDDFRGRTEGELFVWAKTILKNEILQQQRAFLADKRNLFREQQIQHSDNSSSIQFGIEDNQLTPKTDAIQREQSDAVENAILQLPDEYQTVIRLRNSQQLTFAEIGKKLNKSENATTKLWFRALVRLRKELEIADD